MAGHKNKQYGAAKPPKRTFGGGQWNRFEPPARSLTQHELERQRELKANSVERRQAMAGEEQISVTVVGPNPISYRGTLYTAGQHPTIRRTEAESLAAKGWVTIP
jgi:hypothetical protein